MEENVSANPLDVRLFRSDAVVLDPNKLPNLVQETRFRRHP
jgi:hypothetical protein